MTEESHALVPPCPWWCLDREYEGTSDHPDRHEGPIFVVDLDALVEPTGTLSAQLVQPTSGPAEATRVILSRDDDDYVSLAGGPTRSLAAALVKLADVLEGLTER